MLTGSYGLNVTGDGDMASIRDILNKLMAVEAGPPETGAGVYGRAGGVAPGAAKKPIPGVQTRMAGPVAQRDYGTAVSEMPMPTPVQPLTAATATPPPQAISQALRAAPPPPTAAMAPPTAPPMEQATSVPFNPPPLDQGTPLAPPPPPIHEGGQTLMPEQGTYLDQESPQEDMMEDGEQAEGELPPIDLGTLPGITLGGSQEEEDAQLEMAAQELARRMLEARKRR